MKRALRWITVGALLGGMPFIGLPWTGAAPTTPRPSLWSSRSVASAVHLMANPVPTPFVAEVGRADLPQGSSGWDANGGATATASTYYPGVGVTGGPALLCSAAPPGTCPPGFPPPFPTVAAAQYPTAQDASTPTGQQLGSTGGPIEVQAGRASAHASLDRTGTWALDSGFRLAGTAAATAAAVAFRRAAAELTGTPGDARPGASPADTSALRIDGMTAETSQSFDGEGALVSTARSVLTGVHVLGDAVTIGSIVTSSTARVDGSRVATNESHTAITGVTVAGQPATVDERGVTVLSGSPEAAPVVKALNDALHQALSKAGDQLVLLSATKSTSAGPQGQASSGSAGGLLFVGDVSDPGLPGPVSELATTVQLGQAGTVATASQDRAGAVAATIPTLPAASAPAPPVPAAGGTAGSPAPVVGEPAPAGAAPAGTAGGAPARAHALSPLRLAGTGDSLPRDLRAVYLAMTLACIAVALWSHRSRVRRLRRRT